MLQPPPFPDRLKEELRRKREARERRFPLDTGSAIEDQRIYEEVCEALTRNSALDARAIEVRVQHGIVALDGSVPTTDMRAIVEACLETVSGVSGIQDHLAVGRSH